MSEGYDPYRVLGCALVIASLLVVVAFVGRAIKEMAQVLKP